MIIKKIDKKYTLRHRHGFQSSEFKFLYILIFNTTLVYESLKFPFKNR